MAACSSCPAGKYSTVGAAACVVCSTGHVSASDAATCISCSTGRYASAGDGSCSDCSSGNYQAFPASSSCLVCEAGLYSLLSASACSQCPAGSYSSASGAPMCTGCAVGTASQSSGAFDSRVCMSCAAGLYQAGSGAATCASCGIDMYTATSGETTCSSCISGQFSSMGSSSCSDVCPSGQYQSGTGHCNPCIAGKASPAQNPANSTSCVSCVSGRYSEEGAATCSICSAGFYQPTSGATSCETCPAGTSLSTPDATLSSSCQRCSAGTYAASGQGSCTRCTAGKFAPVTGSVLCTFCTIGLYQPQIGASGCSACAAGFYSSVSGATGPETCASCPIGARGATAGASSCEACGLGHFAEAAGATECTSCPAGHYQDFMSASSCIACPAATSLAAAAGSSSSQCIDCSGGLYASAAGSARCATCLAGRFSISGSSDCSSCAAGYFELAAGSIGCSACGAGTFMSTTGSSQGCTTCEAGRFSNVLSAAFSATCLGCAGGWYAAAPGASSCEPCQAGRFSLISATGCTLCPAGTASAIIASSVEKDCAACALGSFAPVSGQAYCPACGAGTFAAFERSLACTLCAVGKFLRSDGTKKSSDCSDCAPGMYSAALGSAACLPCVGGKVQVSTGSASCASCEKGKYSPLPGAFVECPECAVGTFSGGGATVCTSCAGGMFIFEFSECRPCQKGMYAPQALRDRCLTCAAGAHTNVPENPIIAGALSCTPCDSGKYSSVLSQLCSSCPTGAASASNQPSCSECSPGMFSEVQGAATCSSCSAGQFSAAPSSAGCATCPPGRAQGSPGFSSCAQCAAGQYASVDGSSTCFSCAIGKSSSIGAALCAVAASGYFISSATAAPAPCPEASTCLGGDLAPIPKPGFWVDRRSARFAGEVLKCFRNTCIGGQISAALLVVAPGPVSQRNLRDATSASNATRCWHRRAYSRSEMCNADALLCAPGSAGALCGACTVDFIYSAPLRVCISCSDSGKLAIIISGVSLATALIMTVTYFGLFKLWTNLKMWWLLGVLRKIDSGSLRVMWSNYQIIQSVNWTLSITFPQPFSGLLGFLSIFSLDFLALDCILPGSTHLTSVYLWSTMPLALASILTLVCLLRMSAASTMVNDQGLEQRAAYCNQFASHLLILTYVVLPSVSLKLFQSLDCIRVLDRRFLRVDTSVNCDSESYQSFLVFDGLLIAVYVSLPMVWFSLLFRKRQRLNPPIGNDAAACFLRDNDPGLSYLKFLFATYRPDYFYFECVEMYRRILFIGILPLTSTESAYRAIVGALLALLSGVFYRETEPFLRDSPNLLVSLAQHAVFLTFCGALAIETGLSNNMSPVVLGVALLGIKLVVIGTALGLAARRYRQQRAENRRREVRRIAKLEWALDFSRTKWQTTFLSIAQNVLPSDCRLVFWYGTLADAKKYLSQGLPSNENAPLAFTLHHPYELDHSDRHVFGFANAPEAVLACSVPHCLLQPLPRAGGKHRTGEVLRSLTPRALGAMQSWSKEFWRPLPGMVLPGYQIVRAYQLASEAPFPGSSKVQDNTNDVGLYSTALPCQVTSPASCLEFARALKGLRTICHANGWTLLYHYTHPALAALIARTGLRMSTQGQGDGGVYFSMQGPCLYGIGTDIYEESIIIECFGRERLEEYLGKGKLDLCIVYGCEPGVLTQVPGGREYAVMVSKATFEAVAAPNHEGHFFLRPDRILGMFLLDNRQLTAKPPASATSTSEATAQATEQAHAEVAMSDERAADHAGMAALAELSLAAAESDAALRARVTALEAARGIRMNEEAEKVQQAVLKKRSFMSAVRDSLGFWTGADRIVEPGEDIFAGPVGMPTPSSTARGESGEGAKGLPLSEYTSSGAKRATVSAGGSGASIAAGSSENALVISSTRPPPFSFSNLKLFGKSGAASSAALGGSEHISGEYCGSEPGAGVGNELGACRVEPASLDDTARFPSSPFSLSRAATAAAAAGSFFKEGLSPRTSSGADGGADGSDNALVWENPMTHTSLRSLDSRLRGLGESDTVL